MLAIRFFRVGKKNQPIFKIVVTNKTNPPRAGRFVEEIGVYDAKKKTKTLNVERAKYWLSVGAQPSPRVRNILVDEKVIEGKKIAKHKKPKKGEPKKEITPAAAAASVEVPAEIPAEAKAETSASIESEPVESVPVAETPAAEAETPKNEDVAKEQ